MPRLERRRVERADEGADLSRADADAAHTAAWIAEHIRNPKAHKPGSRMPAFAEKLKAEEIQSLADYLAALK